MSHGFMKYEGGCLCGEAEDHAIHTVAFRRWLPADWMDEWVPELANSPSDFLRRGAFAKSEDDVLALCPVGKRELDESAYLIKPVGNGDVVAFCWSESYPGVDLTINDDGTWSVDGDIPDAANCFRLEEDVCGSIGDVVDMVRESGSDALWGSPPYAVDVYAWSNEIPFRVVVLESGAAQCQQLNDVDAAAWHDEQKAKTDAANAAPAL